MKPRLSLVRFATSATILSLPLAAVAVEDAARQKEYFEHHKAERLKHIKARQDLLSQEYSCLQGASSVEAVKACDEKNRAAHQAMEEQLKKDRVQRMQDQESRRRAEFDQKMREMQSSGKK